jgi:hypothetical protein
MKSSKRVAAAFLILVVTAVACIQTACASRSYEPGSAREIGVLDRAESQQQSGVTVRAAVPSEAETAALFGLPLYRRDIQPVWIEVRNDTDHRYRYSPVGTDEAYFPPYEVAYMYKGRYKGAGYRAMEDHLYASAMTRWIWPGETRSGWVFTHLSPGTKAFNVDLFSGSTADPVDGSAKRAGGVSKDASRRRSGEDLSFSFFLDVPGRAADHAAIDFQTLYDDAEIARVDLAGARSALAKLDCCPTDAAGGQIGLPFAVVLVGDGREILMALLRADFFERPRAEKPEDVARAPHFDARPADAVFRTRRSGLGDRNELRLWRAPMVVDGEPVWVGQIVHYIGKSTEIGRAFFDDRIDPDLNDARDFMLQTMWYSQSLAKFAWQRVREPNGVGSPVLDFLGRGYFWDGGRVVLWLSGEPVAQTETFRLRWDDPPVEPSR